MKHLSNSILGAFLAIAGFSVLAQEAPPVLPVETFSCNYLDGQDATDLQSPIDAFNAWADSQGITNLTSALLTPQFYSPALEFEVGFLDIWADGASFGDGAGKVISDPSGIEEFSEVVDCPSHSLYALIGIQPPPDGLADNGIFEFSNCTLKENRSVDDGIAAATAIAAMMAPWNIGDAHGLFIPVAGESPDADYSFKWVTYYPSMQAFGTVFDHYSSGAVQTAGDIVDPVMECDSARMYDIEVLRVGEDDAG